VCGAVTSWSRRHEEQCTVVEILEPPTKAPVSKEIRGISGSAGAESGAFHVLDAELSELIAIWPKLPAQAKATIQGIARAFATKT